MSRWIGLLALVAVVCAGCGGDTPAAPASPSGANVASATQGARIVGNVSAGEPLAALAAQVVGTSISSPVGAGGGFTLEGVPAGAVQLRFQGSGVDASVALNPVQPGDVVSVLVGVSAATATIQSESRNAGGKVELEGRVESLPPTQDAGTLVVSGRTVKTTSGVTIIRDGNDAVKTFADLAIGQRVHVRGMLATDAINADLIIIQNTNTWIPVNVNGIVDSLDKTAPPVFTFNIGSRKVQGDGETKLFGDGDVLLPLDALKDGSRVEVKGEQRDGYVYAVRIHVNGSATTEPPQEDSASVEGRLESIKGTKPALTLEILVNGATLPTTVTTTSATEVRRRGDVQTLDALAVGQTVHAVGTRMADKSIVARMLQIKDDEPNGQFVIEGPIGGLSGSCLATLRFGINGYSILISASAPAVVYSPSGLACGDLKNGMKVEVEGTRQTDGSVLAAKVTKK